VFAIVELYFMVPDQTERHVKEYTASQQKLVYIYIKRRQEAGFA
jgi:hypothetical protein